MAKITCEFDTQSKDLTVAIDGKAVDNVIGVNFYPRGYDGDGDDYSCAVTTKEHNEDEDIKTYTNLIASETAQAKDMVQKAQASESEQFPGFVAAKDTSKSKAHQDIAGFFAKS